jgi:hypothetical protein
VPALAFEADDVHVLLARLVFVPGLGGHFAGSALGAGVGARLGGLRRAGVHGPKIYNHPDALSKPARMPRGWHGWRLSRR